MRLIPVPEGRGWLPYALHIANRNLVLTIVLVGEKKVPMGGWPAVLTDGVGWFSAELVEVPNERLFVAAAVNGYGDKATAQQNAEARA